MKLITAINSDSVLSKLKLIAEPWDTKGYALGHFPNPWREVVGEDKPFRAKIKSTEETR